MKTEKIELTVNPSHPPLQQINRPAAPRGTAALTKPNLLDRTHFKISRSAEYFDVKELVAQTGQPNTKFGEVVLKELLDNALDACEGAGVKTAIHIGTATDGDKLRIGISDNGAGISANVIASILDFDTRTSDKAAYRAPTLGAQGNAFKTIIGIPHALGGGRVIVESKGLRHEITATATPAGTIEINRQVSRIINKVGTTVYVDLPWRECRADWYARAAALFNPHANVKITFFDDMQFSMLTLNCAFSESTISYNRLTECIKIKSNEPTSAHWYDHNDFSKLVYLQALQNDIGIGQFVRQFRGLASTGKAKEITNGLPFKLVSDIHTDNAAIATLHKAMLDQSKPVQPKALGAVGEVNLLARFYVDGRHWYKQVSGMIHNIPYVFEILIAESNEAPGFYFGVNHSPTFGDFLRSTLIFAGELKGIGIAGTLADLVDEEHVVVVHLIGIGLPFLDRGKSNLALPQEMKKSISEAVWCVSKVLYKDRQKERRDVAKAVRDHGARLKASENNITMKEAVFKVMPGAIQKATDNERLPANVRALFYKVRDAIQRHTNKPLDYGYFSQNLLIEYWQEFGRNPLIYNDPRGVLYAPHSEEVVQLGTLEVKQYAFPEHEYNKVLYIEKKGVWHTLKAAELHKKYDMAVIAGEGYASEAVRLLLEKAQVGQDYTIFVLHDADPDGYNIARTIQSETKRMPDHNIEVIDLGLSVQDAIEMGLSDESFTRKKQMAQGLKLNDVEQEYFDGELQVHGLKESWICKRIELNAMSARQLVDYVDQGIARSIANNQLAKKVIPPDIVQRDRARKLFTEKLHATIDDVVANHFYIDELKAELLENYIEVFEGEDFRISEYLAARELETWDAPIGIAVDTRLYEYKEAIERSVVAWIQEGA